MKENFHSLEIAMMPANTWKESDLSLEPPNCTKGSQALTWPVHSPTTRSAMNVSSVSPER